MFISAQCPARTLRGLAARRPDGRILIEHPDTGDLVTLRHGAIHDDLDGRIQLIPYAAWLDLARADYVEEAAYPVLIVDTDKPITLWTWVDDQHPGINRLARDLAATDEPRSLPESAYQLLDELEHAAAAGERLRDDEPWPCPVCGINCPDAAAYATHIHDQHGDHQ